MDGLRNLARLPLLRRSRIASSAALVRANRALAHPAAWSVTLALVAALQVALIVTHEPWLDEYQALQLAIQAPDIATLLEWLRYEGHPPLWYLILRGLGHVVAPQQVLPVAVLAIALPTMAAVLLASPFTRAERVLIVLSEFMLFEFFTLSRSLSLGVGIFVLAIATWRSRWSWLFIAILPLCDFLFGVLSIALVVLKWREGRIALPGVAAWLAAGLLAAWTVRPAPDMIPALTSSGLAQDLSAWLQSVGTLALPFQGGLRPQWNEPVWPIAGVLAIVFLWFAWSDTRRAPWHRLVLFGFIGLTLGFSLVVYPLALRHLMLIALLLIGLVWLRRTRGASPDPAFRLWICVAALCGLATAAINFAMPFDTAAQAAVEIRKRGLENARWVVIPDSRAQGVSALLGMDFERTELRCRQSFLRWNFRSKIETPAQLVAYLRGEVARGGPFYLLSDSPLIPGDDDLLRRIATIDAGYDGQAFYLFEVGAGAPTGTRDPAPPCVEGRRPLIMMAR